MNRDEALLREVAAALETEPELLPYIPELLADLSALGTDPELIARLLRAHGLPAGARVLDLGCGKGAVALEVARALGAQVTGVDAFAPFVEEARRRAHAAGLAHTCRFERGDLRDWLTPETAYDAAVLASVGPLLGGYAATVRGLRRAVRPGGLLLIEDCFLAACVPPIEGEPYLRHAEVLQALTACGDALLQEAITPSETLQATNRANTAHIRARAEALALRLPGKAPALRAYVERQERECALLETRLQCALWVIRRAAGA
jgi:2-polyprenyl-3-methyl-5-hydroxy-6-metoxy-1,4-benzoquinol methylase